MLYISAPFVELQPIENDFIHRYVSCWNNWPSAITNVTSLKQCTNALARADLANYLQYTC